MGIGFLLMLGQVVGIYYASICLKGLLNGEL